MEEGIQELMEMVGLAVTRVLVHHLQTPTQWQQLIQMSRPLVEQQQQHLEWLETAHLFKFHKTTLRPQQTTRPTIKTKTSSGNVMTRLIQMKMHKTRCIRKSGMGGKHSLHKAIILQVMGTTKLHPRQTSYNDDRIFCRCTLEQRANDDIEHVEDSVLVAIPFFSYVISVIEERNSEKTEYQVCYVQENTKVKVGYKCGRLGSSVLCYISHSLNQINSKKLALGTFRFRIKMCDSFLFNIYSNKRETIRNQTLVQSFNMMELGQDVIKETNSIYSKCNVQFKSGSIFVRIYCSYKLFNSV